MKLLGYGNRWSGAPGDRIEFRVSAEAAHFDVDIVRLFQVDHRPEAPPYREQVIPATCAGRYPGRRQVLHTGSYLRAPHHHALETASFCFTAWIYPTAIPRGRQGLFGKRIPGAEGIEVLIDEQGRLRIEWGVTQRASFVLESQVRLSEGWHLVVAQYDAPTRRAMLWHKLRNASAPQLEPAEAQCVFAVAEAPASNTQDVLIGALHSPESGAVAACFNGKMGGLAVYDRALNKEEIDWLYAGGVPASGAPASDARVNAAPASGAVAKWDLAAYPFGSTVPDRSVHALDAIVVNGPTRAVTGPHWDGSASHFQMKPAHYDAIYFHDDDLEDAGWSVDFTWQIPADTPSGVYAARLRAGPDEDHIPFVVRPARATARTLVILPTFTYLAYANERFHAHAGVDWSLASDRPLKLSAQDAFSARTPELGCSIYDSHADGTCCTQSSLLRPVVNFRPKLTAYWNDAGRHFGADMYLVDWLDRMGFQHDVATDHDLHAQGGALLDQYEVVILGSHPEYVSVRMRDALDHHVATGGRLMYMAGNGVWWVTDLDLARPHVIEVRKAFYEGGHHGMGVGPGEEYLSVSGHRGGSWRASGRSPESLLGVGFTAQGFCQARGYTRTPASFDPRVRFIFEGIGDNEVIGDFGLALGGAAGDEFDRAFVDGDTPPNTFVLASSANHPEQYCVSISSVVYQPAEKQGNGLRSDITYYETPSGGAVFSAGSMCWFTSLPYNNYDNNVARITANVLRNFLK